VENNPIPNDDLGEWGEAEFCKLCAAAGLVANKAIRDKMGWDFIVEAPPAASTPVLPLDQRPNGLGCRVQVKTHWRREDDRFEMTLSAAERLAKDRDLHSLWCSRQRLMPTSRNSSTVI